MNAGENWQIVLADGTTFTPLTLQVAGAGMPPLQNITIQQALKPGVLYQSTKAKERYLSLKVLFSGYDFPDLLYQRNLFIEKINPFQSDEFMLLRYIGGSEPIEIYVVIDGGLELGDRKGYTEEAAVRFLAPNPFFYAITDNTAVLGVGSQVANANYILTRNPQGTWSVPNLGMNDEVTCLVKDANGNLIAGGKFTQAGSVSTNRIAKWNGGAQSGDWSAFGNGMDNKVNALAIDMDGSIYAGGSFATADGIPMNGIAKWNGSAWVSIDAAQANQSVATYASGNQDSDFILNTSGSYSADQCYNGLAISGGYLNADTASKAFDNLTTTAWTSLQAGTSINNNAYIGYSFGGSKHIRRITIKQSANSANRLTSALFQYSDNNTTWTTINTIALVDDENVNSYDISASGLHRYWRLLANSNLAATNPWSVIEIEMTEVNSAKLAQSFYISTTDTPVNKIKLWLKKVNTPSGNIFVTLETNSYTAPSGTIIANGTSASIAADSVGTSYAWVEFTFPSPCVIKKNTTYWIKLGASYAPDASAYIDWGADGSTPSYSSGQMKSWNGTTWIAENKDAIFDVISGTLETATLLVGYDGYLYASFVNNDMHMIAKRVGTSWSYLGNGIGLDGRVNSMAMSADGTLYVGGDFITADGLSANRIAKWNGSNWSAVGTGMDAAVYAILMGENGLVYAGGAFTTADGMNANHIAVWDGIVWNALGQGMNGDVLCLALDKAGYLLAGGTFTTADGLSMMDSLAEWNGQRWFPMDVDLPGIASVQAVLSDDEGYLWIGYATNILGSAQVGEVTSIQNDGSASAYPVLEVTGAGKLVWLVNYTSGERIYFDQLTLLENETLTLDMSRIYHNDVDGRKTAQITCISNFHGNYLGKILPGSDVSGFHLLPGNNQISLLVDDASASDASASATLRWRKRYWSIDGVGGNA
ncbi:MAG: discoidin domain-containing protein [Chloroflexota bacterium]